MENRSKIQKIREALNEVEASITGKKDDGRAEDRIRSAADKGRDAIGVAEDRAIKVAGKAKEVKRKYQELDENKKKGLWTAIGVAAASIVALIGINKIKKMNSKNKQYEE